MRQRLLGAGAAAMVIICVGTAGYYALGGGRWSVTDCAYMTVISITTVGYGEVLQDFSTVAYARIFTIFLVIAGTAVSIYFISVLTTYLVEGEFFHVRRGRKMKKRIEALHNHVIVCGAGRLGTNIVSELHGAHRPFLIIERDPEGLRRCEAACDASFPHLIGDATDDAVLLEAGIERASGVVAALSDDKDNLYIVITARGLNNKLRIVSKGVDPRAVEKLRVAGADSVVSVNHIGGFRMAAEMIRPNVVGFLDKMMSARDQKLRFEEITIPVGSNLAGKSLLQTDIRREGNLLIIAASQQGAEDYTYSPGPNYKLAEGMTLIVLGETKSVQRLRESPQFNTA